MGPQYVSSRELGIHGKAEWNGAEVVNKIDLYKEYEAHDGCVNALKWNRKGSLLASGSDDTRVKLWDVEGNLKCTYETSHTWNIFGIEFVPGTNDTYMMTCAADRAVILTDLETKKEISKWMTEDRVKKITSSSALPSICWSISEDKYARMHDMRDAQMDIKIRIGYTGKAIDLSDTNPHLLAVGSESTRIPLFDTRLLARPVLTVGPLDKKIQDPFFITHLTFAKKSNELLVNYGRGSTYLFDLSKGSETNVFVEKFDELLALEEIDVTESTVISSPIQSILDESHRFLSDLHYSEAFRPLNNALKCKDLSNSERASLLLKRSLVYTARKWEGDSYASAQDALAASHLLPSDSKTMLRLIHALQSMEQTGMCLEVIRVFQERFPEDAIEVAELEATLMASNQRVRSIRRNGMVMRDYRMRYAGHMNNNTDIKEAVFFGPNEEYIMSACDSGHIFVYDREDGRTVTLLKANTSVCNSICPHPFLPLVASSGISNDIALFAPYNHSPSPLGPSLTRRIGYPEAEGTLARQFTRNLLRDLVVLNRLTGEEGDNRCQVS